MKTTFTIIALAGLAACAPPPKPICDPLLRTYAIPHGCDKNDDRQSAAPVAVTVPALPSAPEAPDAPPADPVTPPADDHPPAVTPPAADKPKGNASANNGRGGNYDRTGHEDNGKGNGRGRP